MVSLTRVMGTKRASYPHMCDGLHPSQRHEGFPACSPERRFLNMSCGAPVYGVSRSCTGVARASTLVPKTSTYSTLGLSHPSSVCT